MSPLRGPTPLRYSTGLFNMEEMDVMGDVFLQI